MKTKIILVGSRVCELCEHALDVVEQLRNHPKFSSDIEIEQRDILLDDGLFDLYRYEIPVLLTNAHDRVLKWPFGIEDLTSWLESQNINPDIK